MCMGQQKRNWPDFLSENNISELPILKLMLRLCLCSKHTNICMSVYLHVSLTKSTFETGVKFLFFSFSIYFLMKTLVKSIIYCQTVFTNVCCENCMSLPK